MSETVTNAVEAPTGGNVPSVKKKLINPKYFSYLYLTMGLVILIFGNAAFYGNPFNAYDSAIFSAFGLLFLVLGYLDYRSVKAGASNIVYPIVIFILGVVFMLLFIGQYDAPPLAPLEIVPIQTKSSIFYIHNYVVRGYLEGMSTLGILYWIAALAEIAILRIRNSAAK